MHVMSFKILECEFHMLNMKWSMGNLMDNACEFSFIWTLPKILNWTWWPKGKDNYLFCRFLILGTRLWGMTTITLVLDMHAWTKIKSWSSVSISSNSMQEGLARLCLKGFVVNLVSMKESASLDHFSLCRGCIHKLWYD